MELRMPAVCRRARRGHGFFQSVERGNITGYRNRVDFAGERLQFVKRTGCEQFNGGSTDAGTRSGWTGYRGCMRWVNS
jgi:hypothetical protein